MKFLEKPFDLLCVSKVAERCLKTAVLVHVVYFSFNEDDFVYLFTHKISHIYTIHTVCWGCGVCRHKWRCCNCTAYFSHQTGEQIPNNFIVSVVWDVEANPMMKQLLLMGLHSFLDEGEQPSHKSTTGDTNLSSYTHVFTEEKQGETFFPGHDIHSCITQQASWLREGTQNQLILIGYINILDFQRR